ncbi:MAG: hypothetical protein ACI8W7_000269 [Gammaproteobacteria bacterium]|jgi:hypothetical protein
MAEWVFLGARPDWTQARFAQWLSLEVAPRLARTLPGLQRCRVHLVPNPGPPLPGFLSDEPNPVTETVDHRCNDALAKNDAAVGYDAAVLLDGTSDLHPQSLVDMFREGALACHVYRATATVVKEACGAQATPWAQGITYLRPITFHADMAPSAARRSWTLHAPLAVRTHLGACRYVQWWIDAVLSPHGPPIAGIVEMRFPSDQNLAQQFFASERARQDIARDTGHFIAGGTRLYTREQELLN